MEYTVWTLAPIVLLPFFGFVLNTVIAKKSPNAAAWLSVAAVFGSFIYSFRIFSDFVFGAYSSDYYVHKFFRWIDLSWGTYQFNIDMGFYIDNMTAVMLLMVSGCATLIHLFSTYYMKGDARYGRFFVYLGLFTSAMLGLVVSDNLLSLFIFWEIMGFCSYSLIGFYYEQEGAGNASIKAFMTTRVGDVILLLAILAIWSVVGNVNYVDIYAAISAGAFAGKTVMGIGLASFAAFCVFAGTIGKSAQFPLNVWLPDAMWGPTPCSALIHAATMVAAGVYLSLRMYPLMELGNMTTFIAYTGAITAFGAATIALVQTDIKAVLAFSTISQLGYMVLGIGVGAYNAAFMHLITHAVFKACLFMSAGSVIHSLHDHHTHGHVQEMPRMGGLKNKMPFTFWAMMFCTLAISGVPFFSGFVSKDRILGDSLYWGFFHHKEHMLVPILGFAAAFLTAFYMFRMMFLTFFGEPRDKEIYDHCHKESFSFNRNLPLIILSVFTLGLFYSGSLTGQKIVKVAGEKIEWFDTLVQKPVVSKFESYIREPLGTADIRTIPKMERSSYDPDHGLDHEEAHHLHVAHNIGAILSIIIALSGIFLAFLMYFKKSISPSKFVNTFSGWYRALNNKYYMDNFYNNVVIDKGLMVWNRFLAILDMSFYDKYAIDGWKHVNRWLYKAHRWFDNIIVDSVFVDGTGTAVNLFNLVLRIVQSGKIQFYFIVTLVVLAGYIWSL